MNPRLKTGCLISFIGTVIFVLILGWYTRISEKRAEIKSVEGQEDEVLREIVEEIIESRPNSKKQEVPGSGNHPG